MRLQAHALGEAGAHEQSIDLLNRILKDHPNHLTAWVYEQRAEQFRAIGSAQSAIDDYLHAIDEMRRAPSLRGDAPVRLASFVCDVGRDDLYEVSLQALTEFWDPDPLFPRNELHQFGWTAVLLALLGMTEDAKPPARRALAAAAKTKSKAANHPKLGLSQSSDGPLVARLQVILGATRSGSTVDTAGFLAKLKKVLGRDAG